MPATILIVEDEEILRDLIAEEVRKRGYKVSLAANGKEGWQQAQEVKPAMILLDLLMPEMSGYDFLVKLRADDELKTTPCIVISNSGQIDDLNRAYECGADDVLIKADFNPDQVAAKIEGVLEARAKGKGEGATEETKPAAA